MVREILTKIIRLWALFLLIVFGRVSVFKEDSVGSQTFSFQGHILPSTTPTGHPSGDHFGNSVGIGGRLIAVGSPNADGDGHYNIGAAYFFIDYDMDDTWSEILEVSSDLWVDEGSRFGESVAVSADGRTIAAGQSRGDTGYAYEAGVVYVYYDALGDGSGFCDPLCSSCSCDVARLYATEGVNNNGGFGMSVHIYEDFLLVGATNFENDAGVSVGAVFIHKIVTEDTIVLTHVIQHENSTQYANFGSAIAMLNHTLIIGARGEDTGVVYVYDMNCKNQCLGNVDCLFGSTCVDSYRSFECECQYTHDGTFCENCLCENGAICADEDGVADSNYCNCTNSQHIGFFCETECIDGGISVEAETWAYTRVYECNCSIPNAIGATCANSCHNGKPNGDFSLCNCTDSGASGIHCEIDINDCSPVNPCQNSGVCEDLGLEFFPNRNNEFNCTCTSQFRDPVCGTNTFCDSSPCLNNGVCVTDGGSAYCNCSDTGFEGSLCEREVDDCVSHACLNGGTCVDGFQNYTCECAEHYVGAFCQFDKDYCAAGEIISCVNGATCVSDRGQTCACADGYEGDRCEMEIDECVSDPCQRKSECYDLFLGFFCECEGTGYTGVLCSEDVDNCESSPCMHEGICTDSGKNKYTCDCLGTGYTGLSCETDIDDCASAPCQNSGTCVDVGANMYNCLCLTTHTGLKCDEIAETQVFFIEFTGFTGADTPESFEAELPLLLAESVPGSSPNDFLVSPVENANGFTYEVTFVHREGDAIVDIAGAVEDGPISDRVNDVNTDTNLSQQVQEETEETQSKPDNNLSFLIVIIGLAVVILLVAVVYAAFKMNHTKHKNVKDYKLQSKLAIPV